MTYSIEIPTEVIEGLVGPAVGLVYAGGAALTMWAAGKRGMSKNAMVKVGTFWPVILPVIPVVLLAVGCYWVGRGAAWPFKAAAELVGVWPRKAPRQVFAVPHGWTFINPTVTCCDPPSRPPSRGLLRGRGLGGRSRDVHL